MAARYVPVSEYDNENAFAKILDKKVAVHKVYESRTTLAFLESHPVVEGHTVVIPKLKGHKDFVSMPAGKAAEFLSEVQKVARAVKKAFEADGVQIWQNSGESAGQTVFHPHFHVVPRKAGDGLKDFKYPAGAAELSADAAKPVQAKLEEAMRPKVSMRLPKWARVSSIKPDSTGLNLKLKVVGDAKCVESKVGKFYEALCGDASGTVVVSLREGQEGVLKKDAIVAVRNASTKMVGGHVRLAVDKWGKIEKSTETMEEEVEMAEKKNVSATQYELVVSK